MEVHLVVLELVGIVCDPVATGGGTHREEHCGVVPLQLARDTLRDREWFGLH